MLESGKRYFLKGEDKTEEIESWEADEKEQIYNVKFKNNKKIYPYSKENAYIIDENIWNYFIKYVECEKRNCKPKKQKIFEKRQENLSKIHNERIGKTALGHYLCPNDYPLEIIQEDTPVIYPFEYNSEQYTAVDKALKYSMSVIEGAPGTGKTQTILNIVANIVIREKTVLVVLANTAILDNMEQKLQRTDMRNIYDIYDKELIYKPSEKDCDCQSGAGLNEESLLKELKGMEWSVLYHISKMESVAEKRQQYVKKYLNPEDSINYEVDLHVLKKEFEMEKQNHIKILQEYKKISKDYLSTFLSAREGHPITLTGSFSAVDCIDIVPVYDYVIIDEAAQIDIITGVQALACGRNAVIVGDSSQLNHIADEKYNNVYKEYIETVKIDELYNCAKYNFLDSVKKILNDKYTTELLEHYRCHPAIIQFCNEQFYENKLLIMTEWAEDVKGPIEIVRTTSGYIYESVSKKGIWNDCEISYAENWLENFMKGHHSDEVGFITPYRKQADVARKRFEQFNMKNCNTIHKYQGGEKDYIILSLVRDNLNDDDFINNKHMLNTAITRAKKHLYLIMSSEDQKSDKVIGKLADYAEKLISLSKPHIHPILKKKDGEKIIKEYLEKYPGSLQSAKPQEYEESLAEQIFEIFLRYALSQYNSLLKEKLKLEYEYAYPLKELIPGEMGDTLPLSKEEKQFVYKTSSHIDFSIWKDGKVCLAIEIDGPSHDDPEQEERDEKKNSILDKYKKKHEGFKWLRIGISEADVEKKFLERLDEVLGL